MADFGVHNVKGITLGPVHHYPVSKERPWEFCSRDLFIHSKEGMHTVKLFADLRADLLTDGEKVAEAEKVPDSASEGPYVASEDDRKTLELVSQTF